MMAREGAEEEEEEDVYSQDYEAAVRARMEWFSEEEMAERRQARDNYARREEPQAVTRNTRVMSLNRVSGQLVCTDMSGGELFRLPLRQPQEQEAGSSAPAAASAARDDGAPATARELREQLAERCRTLAGGVSDASDFTLFQGDTPLADGADVCDADSLVVKQVSEELTVFVCRRPTYGVGGAGEEDNTLGWVVPADNPPGSEEEDDDDYGVDMPVSGVGEEELARFCYPPTAWFQALQQPSGPFRGSCWLLYHKTAVSMAFVDGFEPLIPIGVFPRPPAWPLPQGASQCGGPRSDVWTVNTPHLVPALQRLLNAHAALMADRPIPRYQMIVDPNRFVLEDPCRSGRFLWVPCEFDVDRDGTPRLVGGPRSHLFPQLAAQVATPVLAAALPLLARLTRPRLLLERRRLQVVFKAQRIIVPADRNDHSGNEYVGLWHMDGHAEQVAAVVLYYYRVDPELQGGDMEFCGREMMDGWLGHDCRRKKFSKFLRDALRKPGPNGLPALASCRVQVGEGTLLVFSNYQMIHRVLRMVNSSTEREASRDFVALFVIDPAVQPLVPARLALAKSYELTRTLTATGPFMKCEWLARLILEFVGVVTGDKEARRRRNGLLLEQLTPQGQFQPRVYYTGNSDFSMVGWLHKMLLCEDDSEDLARLFRELRQRQRADASVLALNLPPRRLNRGMSENFSLDSAEVEERFQARMEMAEELDES